MSNVKNENKQTNKHNQIICKHSIEKVIKYTIIEKDSFVSKKDSLTFESIVRVFKTAHGSRDNGVAGDQCVVRGVREHDGFMASGVGD